MNPDEFLARIDDEPIVAAIRQAEERSRGEVRVHVSSEKVDDAQAAARSTFDQLGMSGTDERNGVLVFIAPVVRKFAIVGDAGIHALVGDGFWQSIADEVSSEFRSDHYTEGLVRAVTRVGEVLTRHFPRRPGETDRNELPDEISRG